jgi:hypothetical protein
MMMARDVRNNMFLKAANRAGREKMARSRSGKETWEKRQAREIRDGKCGDHLLSRA